jgi:hypothetical protein
MLAFQEMWDISMVMREKWKIYNVPKERLEFQIKVNINKNRAREAIQFFTYSVHF